MKKRVAKKILKNKDQLKYTNKQIAKAENKAGSKTEESDKK